jgi:hypothetical protein
VIYMLVLYFTYSRGSWIAFFVGLTLAIALDPRRLQLVTAALVLTPCERRKIRSRGRASRGPFGVFRVRHLACRRRPGVASGASVGLWMAFTGLVMVAVASFGGIGTAATSKHNATAASAQYKTYEPKTAKFTKTVTKAQPKQAAAAVAKTSTKPSSQLPFTGLALWVPLAIGLLLFAFGVTLRTRARRHGSGA